MPEGHPPYFKSGHNSKVQPNSQSWFRRGLIAFRLAHVSGFDRQVKAYWLTAEGHRLAATVKAYVEQRGLITILDMRPDVHRGPTNASFSVTWRG